MKYIKPGTIGYVKSDDLKIYQVRCCDYEINGYLFDVLWEVAGTHSTFLSSQDGVVRDLYNGVFKTPAAAYGHETSERVSKNAEFDERELIQKFYPKASFVRKNSDAVSCYVVRPNMEIEYKTLDPHYRVTQNGVEPVLHKVDNGEYFLTREDAEKSRPTPEIITFDDEQPQEQEEDTMCRIIIDVPKSEIANLQDCNIVKIVGSVE